MGVEVGASGKKPLTERRVASYMSKADVLDGKGFVRLHGNCHPLIYGRLASPVF
jgi:hypothetical protein